VMLPDTAKRYYRRPCSKARRGDDRRGVGGRADAAVLF
jgi:hypothetical protein